MEYSRDLSNRISRAKKMAAQNGLWTGGPAPYGFRRMLVSGDGSAKRLLKKGELKSRGSFRTVLVPGPRKETSRIQEIYRLALSGLSTNSIAMDLNHRGMKCCGHRWNRDRVFYILHNPTYAGILTFGRTTGLLGRLRVAVPKENWTLVPGAVKAIVDPATFEAAQRVLHERTRIKSDQELLDALRALLVREGRLTQNLIRVSRNTPSVNLCRDRFGGMRRTYELIGYHEFDNHKFGSITQRHLRKARRDLFSRVIRTFKGIASIGRQEGSFRRILCFEGDLKISVLVCPFLRTNLGNPRWFVPVRDSERGYPTLICRCNEENKDLKDMYLVPSIDRARGFRIMEHDPWLKRGKQISELSSLHRIAVGMREPTELT